MFIVNSIVHDKGMDQTVAAVVADYLAHRRSLDLSASTLKNEQSTFRLFCEVLDGVMAAELNDRHLVRYFDKAGETRAPQSLANDHTRLSAFFEWSRRTGRIPSSCDPMYGRRKPKGIKRERNRVDVSQFGALLDAADARHPRDRAVLACLLYTLARDGELSGARIRDLSLTGLSLRVTLHKTRAEDELPVCEELERELRAWLTHYASEVGELQPHYYLLPSRDTRGVNGPDGRLSVEHVRLCPERRIPELGRIVSPALDDIGFPLVDEDGKSLREGAHTIRRSGARALFEQLVAMGYDGAMRVVQSMLHHATLEQTEAYLGLTPDRNARNRLLRGQVMLPPWPSVPVADVSRRDARSEGHAIILDEENGTWESNRSILPTCPVV